MLINEAHGIVSKEGIRWSELTDCIIDYIFDLEDGLNADPFYKPDEAYIIDSHNIISYYKFKYGTLPENLIPTWIHKFEVILNNKIKSNGYFNKKDAKLIDNKLEFEVCLNDISSRTPDELSDTLSHEFRHAYTRYIELSKNISIRSNSSKQIYKEFKNAYYKEGVNKDDIIKSVNNDIIILRDDVYTNKDIIYTTILTSFYYVDIDETNSFLQSYEHQMSRVIRNKRNEIAKSINNANKLKYDFNKLTRPEQWQSNIMNVIPVSCYDNRIYIRYKSYLMFWEGIRSIDDDLAIEVVDSLKTQINTFLKKNTNHTLVEFTGDATNVLNVLKTKIQPRLNKIIDKMEKIFSVMIINLDDEISSKHINEGVDLDNFDFNDDINNNAEIKLSKHKITAKEVSNKLGIPYVLEKLKDAYDTKQIFASYKSSYYKDLHYAKINGNVLEVYSKGHVYGDSLTHYITVNGYDEIDIVDIHHRSNLGTGDTFKPWIEDIVEFNKDYNMNVHINKFTYQNSGGSQMHFIIYNDLYTISKKYYPKELYYEGSRLDTLIVQGQNTDLTDVCEFVDRHSNSKGVVLSYETKSEPLIMRIMERYVKSLPNFEQVVHDNKFDEIYYDELTMNNIYEDLNKANVNEVLNQSHKDLKEICHIYPNPEFRYTTKLCKQVNKKLGPINKKHSKEERIHEWLSYNLVKVALLYINNRLPYMTNLFIEERNNRRLHNTLGIYTYKIDLGSIVLDEVCDRAKNEFDINPEYVIKLGEYAYQYILNRKLL